MASFHLFFSNVTLLIGLYLFGKGFFPYKPFIPGLAQYETLDFGDPPPAPFDKLIFMVVDALRSDFVYSEDSGFAFTQSLISDGGALPFTAHATPPTVTMPRLKAITSGSVPSYLDAILNLAESDTTSTLAKQDTWLAQMKAKDTGKVNMFGDDTWLKLFPGTFDRADGTTSFFVADFTIVDNNVTRNVAGELSKNDWNTMILHYLGLDHIGHSAGPRSPNMVPKQQEMDDIVRQIYDAIAVEPHLQSTLLVLCGDHGMNDVGNHGGSGAGETSAALVFISPKMREISGGLDSPLPAQDDYRFYKHVQQSDIAPTLGALLGFPSPQNNLGNIITDFLPLWPDNNHKFQLLFRNAKQMFNIVKAKFLSPPLEEHSSQRCSFLAHGDKLACEWQIIVQDSRDLKDFRGKTAEQLLVALTEWSKSAQDIMSRMASNYDLTQLWWGMGCTIVAVLFATSSFSFQGGSILIAMIFTIMTLAYGLMMFTSSYVEEEHQFWYWASSGWLVFLTLQGSQKSSPRAGILSWRTYFKAKTVLSFVVLRLIRRWNQTGQKVPGAPDIARTLLHEHTTLLWCMIVATYLANTISSATWATWCPLGWLLLGIIYPAMAFKCHFTSEAAPYLLTGPVKVFTRWALPWLDLVEKAWLVWALVGTSLATIFGIEYYFQTIVQSKVVLDEDFERKETRRLGKVMDIVHDSIGWLLMTQSSATNIPMFLGFRIIFSSLKDFDLNVFEISVTSLLFQYMSFFAFGGSNSPSSIDLSNAYNGVKGYNALVVGLLTFAGNWAGPIYWTSATSILLARQFRKGGRELLKRHLSILTIFTTISVLFVMLASYHLREHLFIWSVFSPKYLYASAWVLGQHLCINFGFGTLLYWFYTSAFSAAIRADKL